MSSSIGSATSTWRMTTTNIFDDYTLTLNFSKLSKNEAMLASPFQAGKRVLRIDKKIRLMSVSEKPAHLPLPKPDINLINLLSVGFCFVHVYIWRRSVNNILTNILTYSIGLWQIPSNLPWSVFFPPEKQYLSYLPNPSQYVKWKNVTQDLKMLCPWSHFFTEQISQLANTPHYILQIYDNRSNWWW